MAHHIDHTGSSHERGTGCCLSQDERAIRRLCNGAIDLAYYEKRARALRARCMRFWLHRLIRSVVRFWRRRAVAAELWSLDESAMRDIGIARSDIAAIASGAYFQDESRRQRGTVHRVAPAAGEWHAAHTDGNGSGAFFIQPGKTMHTKLTTLEYLQHLVAGTVPEGALPEMKYPTAISQLLGFRVIGVDKAYARLEMDADADVHGNQQGTVHGGLLSELADAAIGTAHSTAIETDETFTSIDLRISFFRPVWKSVLTATARPVQLGRTITHYHCEIVREDGKLVALASGTVMTLRGAAAAGR